MLRSSPRALQYDKRRVYDTFTNYAEGYELSVDKGMTVDMSYSAVAARARER